MAISLRTLLRCCLLKGIGGYARSNGRVVTHNGPQRQETLWAIALENYQAAVFTAQHGWHNVSVTWSYYAMFMAMWVALDDPPKGYWEHRGISKPFASGQW